MKRPSCHGGTNNHNKKGVTTYNFNEMKTVYTIALLAMSNTFMTFAWYGHLKFKELKWFETLPLVAIVLISWGIALFEYKLSFKPQK